MKAPRGKYWHWIMELSTFDYKLAWCPGKKMDPPTASADPLHMYQHMQEEEEEDNKFIRNVQDGQIDMEKIRLAQEEDEVLQEVKRWIKGNPPTKLTLREGPLGLP